jgi:hypothetical protein
MTGQKIKETRRHLCKNHPDRIPWLSRYGEELCYECLYGKDVSDAMLGASFYEPGGPGYCGEKEN